MTWYIKDKFKDEDFIEICENSNSMASAASKMKIHFNSFKKHTKKLGCYKTNQSGKGMKKQSNPTYTLSEILEGKHPHFQTFKLKNVAGTIDKWGRHYNYDIFQTKIRLPQNLNPFFLKRKSELFKVKEQPVRLIKSVEFYSKENTQCISVSAADQLYITDNCIVTHNTFLNACIIVDEAQNVTHEQLEMITTRIGMNSKMVVCGDDAQIDLKNKRDSGFKFLYTISKKIKNMEAISLYTNHRDSIVDDLIEKYYEFYQKTQMKINSGHTKN